MIGNRLDESRQGGHMPVDRLVEPAIDAYRLAHAGGSNRGLAV